MKKKQLKTKVYGIMFIVFGIMFSYAGYQIVEDKISQNNYEKQREKLSQIKQEEKGKKLSEMNSDYVGWLSIEGMAIDTAVVQTTDNDYYLTHDFEGKKSKYGAVFMDTRSKKGTDLIIYGHHMKDGTVFAPLFEYKSDRFIEEHKRIRYCSMEEECKEYKIFAVIEMDLIKEAYDYTEIIEKKISYEEYLKEIRGYASYFDEGVKGEQIEQIMVLSTCSYISKDARFAVFGYR